jgi:hypothetical protein
MAMYRKKPVVIEARQFPVFLDIHDAHAAGKDLAAWCGGRFYGREPLGRMIPVIEIDTLEGTMTARPGDWVIKGVQGEFYPCKPDVFWATYELADDDPPDPYRDPMVEDRIRDAMTEATAHPGRTITR